MINIEKQVAYWRDGAVEDWEIAQELIERGRTRHGLFFVHLSLEKLLKAHVCRHTQDWLPGSITWYAWLNWPHFP
jgi:HEPN domain.